MLQRNRHKGGKDILPYRSILRGLTWVFAGCVIGFCILTLGVWGLYYLDEKSGIVSRKLDVPDLAKVRMPFAQPSWVSARGGETLSCYAEEYRIPIELSDANVSVRNAIIASEDQNFDDDNSWFWRWFVPVVRPGYDIRGISRALIVNLAAGHVVQGGSTLDQQVIKGRVLTPERTWTRKFKEVFLAVKMKQNFFRDEVLEVYMNMVYLGGPYGFEAAARTYFKKSAKELSVDEAALLAGMINDSRPLVALFRTTDTKELDRLRMQMKARRDRVLRFMRDKGSIRESELVAALERPISIKPFVSTCDKRFLYLSEMVRKEYEPQLKGLHTGGYRIKTTIDFRYQQKLERACDLSIEQYVKRHPENKDTIRCSSIVVETKTGVVRALVGGQNFIEDQYNGVTQAKRQPGSAFPFKGPWD